MYERLLALAVAAALLSSCTSTIPYDTHIALQAGQIWLDDDWGRFDEVPRVGLDVAMVDDNGVGAEYGLDYARKSKRFDVGGGSTRGDVQWGIAYLGVRKTFVPERRTNYVLGGDRIVPYIAVGLAGVFVRAETSTAGSSDNDDDIALAGYIRAGSDFMLSRAVFLGLDVRYLFGSDVELDDEKLDLNHLAAAVRLGWSF